MKYKKYPSYKDSGVEWLGEIPENWNIKRLKNVIRASITDGPHETPEFTDKGIPFLSVDGIQEGELTFDKCRYVSEKAHIQYKKKANIERDDILLGKAASIGKVARVKVDFEFSIWSPLALIKPDKNEVSSNYLEYLLKSSLTQYQIQQLSTSNTQQNISMADIPKFIFSLPIIKEQQQIAKFLDNATQKMDTLIQKQENLIKLLKEKRQAVISHAVTRGLNPEVKFKDSGVEWLGDVPEHWGVGLLSTLFDNNKDKNKGMKNNNLLSLSYGKIVNKDIDTAFGLLPESFESYQIVKPGYIILRLTDLQNDKKSLRTGLVTEKGIITSAYVGLKKKSKSIGNEKFIHYYLHTFDIYKGFYGMGSGVRQSLNFDELKKLRFLVPPINEQDEIVKFIDDKTKKIDKLIKKATKSIKLLKEKRTALISAAVTGKIDVRELV